MDSLKLPLPLYVFAVAFFLAPGLVLLVDEGHWPSALLVLGSTAYAIGLGRVLLWRKLGRPAVPAQGPGGRPSA